MSQKLTPEEKQEIKELQKALDQSEAKSDKIKKRLRELIYKIERI